MQIIAHRGASGDRPEHTLAGYALAIEQGANIIEPDLVFSADGVLFCRHDPNLRRATDIASRRVLAEGEDVGVADLTAAELRELRCIQPWPAREQSFNGRYTIPSFSELLDLLDAESRRRNRRLLVYPEAKHPELFHPRGHDFEAALAAEFDRRGWHGPNAPVWLQCFDHGLLQRFKARFGMPCFALADQDSAVDLAALSQWCDGLGVAKTRLLTAQGGPSEFTREAHARGLRLHAWTVRHDQPNSRFASTALELRALAAIGVEACFCDFPGRALADLRGV